MVNQVICHTCNKPIETRSDLTTSFYYFLIEPFHNSCYSAALKSITIIPNYPINGRIGNIRTLITSIGAIFIPFVWVMSDILQKVSLPLKVFLLLILLVAFFNIFARIYSYYKYEKPLRRTYNK